MKPGDGVQWAEFPTDTEQIKKAIRLRRRAIGIMLAEMTALQQHLRQNIGTSEWLQFQAEEKQAADADIMGSARDSQQQKESNEDGRDP